MIMGMVLNMGILFIDPQYDYIVYATNVVIVILIALILFYSHIWAGGDSKLLIVIAAVYPACDYFEIDGNKITLWILLMVTFSVGFIYIIVDSILQILKYHRTVDYQGLRDALKGMVLGYIQNVTYIVAFSHIYHYFFEHIIKIPDVLYFIICLLIAFGIQKLKFLQENFSILAVVLFDIAMAIMTAFVPIRKDIRYYILIIAFMVIRAVAGQYNYQVIETSQIKQGMILSRYDTILMAQSKVRGLPGISDETLASRLTDQEAESIKRWENSKQGRETLTIVRKIPFALFISTGVLTYLIIEVFF